MRPASCPLYPPIVMRRHLIPKMTMVWTLTLTAATVRARARARTTMHLHSRECLENKYTRTSSVPLSQVRRGKGRGGGGGGFAPFTCSSNCAHCAACAQCAQLNVQRTLARDTHTHTHTHTHPRPYQCARSSDSARSDVRVGTVRRDSAGMRFVHA